MSNAVKRNAAIALGLFYVLAIFVVGHNRSQVSRHDIRVRLIQPDCSNPNLLEIHITNLGVRPFSYLDVREGAHGVSDLYTILRKTPDGIDATHSNLYSSLRQMLSVELRPGETYVRNIHPQAYRADGDDVLGDPLRDPYSLAVSYAVGGTGYHSGTRVLRPGQRIGDLTRVPNKEIYKDKGDVNFEYRTNFVTLKPSTR